MDQIDVDINKNHIEIVFPGNFLPEGNAQDYTDIRDIPSIRRNEAIADALTACRLMQRSGSGFDKIFYLRFAISVTSLFKAWNVLDYFERCNLFRG